MKKTICLFLVIAISLNLLCACNGNSDFHTVKVTGDISTLITPIMPIYRAGRVVKIKAYPVTDVSLHVFVNGEEIPMSHYDSDYWEFEFVMPEENITIHLTFDQFYGRDEYSFDDLHPLNFLKNEIIKVSVKTTTYSEKHSFIETRYSTRQSDIDNFKAMVEQKLIKADNNIASNASYGHEFCFYFNTAHNGEMSETLYFNDEFFTWNDFSSWQAFRFEDENYLLPTIENPDLVTYSFKYDGRSSDFKSYDDESLVIKYYIIGSVEFVPYEGESIDTASPFYLDSRYGKINLISPTVFELNGEYYEIVSNAQYWAYTYCQLESK